MTIDVLTFGEAMVALRSDGMLRLGGTLSMSVAGAESNVAIGLARLGHTVRWVGRLGDDELGALVLRTLRAEGVRVDDVVVDVDGTTGMVIFDVAPAGIPRVHYRRRASAARNLAPDDLLSALRDGARVVHVSGITPALGELPARTVEESLRAMREARATVSLDVNFRAKLWSADAAAESLRPLVPLVDVLIASEDELPIVVDGTTEDVQVTRLLQAGVQQVVVKRGDQGATVHTADGSISTRAVRVRVVDPVGAGDAFVAGYLSGLLDDLGLADRLGRAVTLGAAAVASGGDWEGLPTRTDLELIERAPGDVLR